jgi:hypothetical protein
MEFCSAIKKNEAGDEGYNYNLSYLRGRDQADHGLKPAWAKS